MRYEKLLEKTKERLPRVFLQSKLRELISELQEQHGFSTKMRSRLHKSPSIVSLNWNRDPHFKVLTFDEIANATEIILSICAPDTRYFASHFSALYWNELTDQRPSTYYLSREVKRYDSTHSENYNEDLVKQAFMKSPRVTSHSFTLDHLEVFMLEKQEMDQIGLTEKTVTLRGIDTTFKLTSIERTLIDSVISPHYSGGILNVLQCFSNAKLNVRELYQIYEKYAPFYPYWQSIGFLLEKTKGEAIGEDWLSYFNPNDMKPFYLDRKYRSTWDFNKKWQIHHPQGLLHD